MLSTKPVKILHFEDQPTITEMVRKKVASELGGKVKSWNNLHNLKYYVENKYILNKYSAIVCDVMFPSLSAYNCMHDLFRLAEDGKSIIFYSCIDEDDFRGEARKILGVKELPENFKYVQKASENNLTRICNYIRKAL
jgi:response regulator RpfG family c-di-GMP phosphodiesterase